MNHTFNSPYTASITGGGFLHEETNALLPLLQSPDRGTLLKDERINNRLLRINAETSRSRAMSEIIRRYDAMPAVFWQAYLSILNQKKLLKRPCMRKYQLEKEQADPSKAQNAQDALTRDAHSPDKLRELHGYI